MKQDLIKDITPPILWRTLNNIKNKGTLKAQGQEVELLLGLDKWPKEDLPNKIFVHIHKCAGTSVWGALNEYPNFLCYIARPGRFAHGLGANQVPEEVWNNAFKFTIVRNPFARVVSAYKMLRGKKWSNVYTNFSEFVEFIQWCDVENHKVSRYVPINVYGNTVDNIIHHCSSYHNPKYRIDEMDYIGKLEELNRVLEVLAPHFNVNSINLPKLNATKADSYREYYTEETKAIIAKKYAKDILRFDYKF